MKLEDYQQDAVNWLSQRKRGIVVAPAGSGKTIIASAALRRVVMSKPRDERVRVGWLANTVEQCEQANAALRSFPDMLPHVYLRIACAASNVDWSSREVLIVDEVHHAAAHSWRNQIETCSGARWGFTATPESDDEERNEALVELFGPKRFNVKRESVQNRLTKATYVMLDATDPDLRQAIDEEIELRVENAKRSYGRYLENENRDTITRRVYGSFNPTIRNKELDEEIERQLASTVNAILWQRLSFQVCIEMGIVNNQQRNAAVIETARRHARDSVLILVNQVEHGAWLAKQIEGAAMCHSKMGAAKRRSTLAEFRVGGLRCVVATSLADEGLDVPIANVLILVSGGRSKAKTEQRTGRVLRTFAGKTGATIYDFIDRQHPLMAKHSRKRVEIYEKLGYQRLSEATVKFDSLTAHEVC